VDIFFDIDCFFIPEKCVFSKRLVPISLRNVDRFLEPIWVSNSTMSHLNFSFMSSSRGLCIVNTKLTVPCQSVWPLMLEYRPSDEKNEVSPRKYTTSIDIINLLKNFSLKLRCLLIILLTK